MTFGNEKEISRKDCKGLKQWIIPIEKTNKKGLPTRKITSFTKNRNINLSRFNLFC